MYTEIISNKCSVALRRVAHVLGTAEVYVEFRDGSVYQIEPFTDADWLELNKPQVWPGTYFNRFKAVRPDFRARILKSWPSLIGHSGWVVAVIYA